MTSAGADDFTYTYSTYNTQMYMGFNAVAGVDYAGGRIWPGDTSVSNVAVDFDEFN